MSSFEKDDEDMLKDAADNCRTEFNVLEAEDLWTAELNIKAFFIIFHIIMEFSTLISIEDKFVRFLFVRFFLYFCIF